MSVPFCVSDAEYSMHCWAVIVSLGALGAEREWVRWGGGRMRGSQAARIVTASSGEGPGVNRSSAASQPEPSNRRDKKTRM